MHQNRKVDCRQSNGTPDDVLDRDTLTYEDDTEIGLRRRNGDLECFIA